MRLNDHIDLKGRLRIQLTDKEGRIVHEQQNDNAIVLDGRDLVARLFLGLDGTLSGITHLAVGTGTNPVADGDAALQSERFRKEIRTPDLDQDLAVITSQSPNKMRLTVSTDLETTEANDPAVPITEAGLFNSATGGIMYNRVVFPPVFKTEDYKLTLIWDILF